MFSERRCAQFGLVAACFVLVITLGVLFRGNIERPIVPHVENGSAITAGDMSTSSAARFATLTK
jgi:hypothetical protein